METLPDITDWAPTHRHFKGGLYRWLGIGRHSETGEEMVIYQNNRGDLWLRPKSMWSEEVDVNGERVPRFTPIQQ